MSLFLQHIVDPHDIVDTHTPQFDEKVRHYHSRAIVFATDGSVDAAKHGRMIGFDVAIGDGDEDGSFSKMTWGRTVGGFVFGGWLDAGDFLLLVPFLLRDRNQLLANCQVDTITKHAEATQIKSMRRSRTRMRAR